MPSLSDMRAVSVLEQRMESNGIDETAAKLDKLAAAQKRVATGANDSAAAVDTQTKTVTSLEKVAERQVINLDKEYAALKRRNDELAKVNRFLSGGALGTGDAAQAEADKRIALIQARYERERKAVNDNVRTGGFAQRSGLSGFQTTNLGYQANDIISGLMMGQSPGMIAAQQGGQVLQILQSSEKGVVGSLTAIGGAVGRFLINPLTLAAGAIGLTGLAWYQYSAAQKEAQRSIEGVGRSIGITLSQMNNLSAGAAHLGGLSQSEALRGMGVFAQTGAIQGGLAFDLTKTARQFGRASGTNTSDAFDRLGTAFTDPTKGAQDLNKVFGNLDFALKQNIANLMAQGDTLGAQQVLLKSYQTALIGVTDQTGALSRAFSSLVNGVGDFGGWLMKKTGLAGTTYDEDLAALAGRPRTGFRGPTAQQYNLESEYASETLRRRQQAASSAASDALSRRLSVQTGDAIMAASPDLSRRQSLTNQAKLLASGLADSRVIDILKQAGVAFDDIKKAAGDAQFRLDNFKTAAQRLAEEGQLSVQSIMARTLADTSGLAAQKAYTAAIASGAGPLEAAIAKENARADAIARANREIDDTLRKSKDDLRLSTMSPYERGLEQIKIQYRDLNERSTMGAVPSMTGAAGLPSATGLNADFQTKLTTFMNAISGISISSGFRSVDKQQQLWDAALEKYGSPESARKWVAPPGASQHNFGLAADLRFDSSDARARAHAMAGQYGLTFPLGNEPWHVEPVGGRGMRGQSAMQAATGVGASQQAQTNAEAAYRNSIFTEGAIRSGERDLAAYNDTLDIQTKALGAGTAAAAAFNKEAEIRAGLLKQGYQPTQADSAAISDLANKYGEAALKAEALNRAQQRITELNDLARDTTKGFIMDTISGMRQGQNAWDAMGKAAVNALSKIAEKMLDRALQDLFNPIGAGSGGFLGSILKSFGFGGGGGGAPSGFTGGLGQLYANGGVFGPSGVHAFALGGAFSNSIVDRPTLFPFANGTGLMGEAGPEAIIPLRRGPDGRLGVTGHGGGSGGGGSPVNVTVINNADGTKATASKDAKGNTTISIDSVVDQLSAKQAQNVGRSRGPLAPAFSGRVPRIG